MLLVLEVIRAYLFLAAHSETNCSSLWSVAVMWSVAVISVIVVAVYSLESFAYIDTWALLKVSGMSLVIFF
jgi:hypothetical protein